MYVMKVYTMDDLVLNQKQQKLESFKHLLDIDRSIWTKEMALIESRHPHRDNISEYLGRQEEIYPVAHTVLTHLLDAIQHVSIEAMRGHLIAKSTELKNGLEEQDDTRFYIALSGYSDAYNPGFDGCRFKSNMWLAILMLNIDSDLLENFVDFLCMGKPMHGEFDTSVGNIVYLDDGSFSGSQIVESVKTLRKHENNIFLDRYKLHFVILYVHPDLIELVKSKIRVRGARWYTTNVHPRPLTHVVNKLKVLHPDIDIGKAKYIMYRFLMGYFDFGGGEGDDEGNVEEALKKPLFYTDLKVPDDRSISPAILFSPVLLNPDGAKIAFGKSLITNCPSSGIEEDFEVLEGTFCPRGTYKTQRWKDFISENITDT